MLLIQPILWFVIGFFTMIGGSHVCIALKVKNYFLVKYDLLFFTTIFPIILIVFITYVLRKNFYKSVLYCGAIMYAHMYTYEYLDKKYLIEKSHPKYAQEYLLLYIGVLLLIVIFIVYKFRGGKGFSLNFSLPSFDFKTLKISFNNNSSSRIILKARPKNIRIEAPERGIYIQGGAGSGKTKSLIEPIIKQSISNNFSGICYDFKSPELTNYLLHNINEKGNGITPYVIDFKDPLKSHRVNPIDPKYLRKQAYVSEFVEALMNNLSPETIKKKEWYDREAQNVLTGLIWYVKKYYPQYCTLPHIISLVLNNSFEKIIQEVSQDNETVGMVASLKQAINLKADKQISAIASTLQGNLAKLNNPEIFWLLSGNDFDLNINDPDNPKFLCLGNDSTLPSVYAPVISLIISVATRLMNEPNKHPSIIILDEAPTIYIPNFEKIPATARSNKVSTVFCAQDYSMLVDSYGEQKAQVIISNLGNQFYGRSSNTKTAQMIQNIFSKQDRTYSTKSKSQGESGDLFTLNSNSGRSVGESIQERNRVKISDVLNASPGEMFGIIAEGKPREFISYKFKYDKTKIEGKSISKKLPIATQTDIEKNFDSLINESKNILQQTKTKPLDPLFE